MTVTNTALSLSSLWMQLAAWAHAVVPAGSARFDGVAIVSLLGYTVFAVVALHYAFKSWAERVLYASLAVATAASLLLHLSLRETPRYVGEGSLWKFVALSQYLPWAVLSAAGVYGAYRAYGRLRQRRG